MLFRSRRARRRNRITQAQRHRAPKPPRLRPRSYLRAGTRQYERSTGELYEVVSCHQDLLTLRCVTTGRRRLLDGDLWRGPGFDPAPRSRTASRDPRKQYTPQPHYFAAPHLPGGRRITAMDPALLDPDAGDLCECGRPREHSIHLAPAWGPDTLTA